MTHPRLRPAGGEPVLRTHGLVRRALRDAVGGRRILALSLAASLIAATATAGAEAAFALSRTWMAVGAASLIVVPDPSSPASSDAGQPPSTRLDAVLALAGTGAKALDRDAVRSIVGDWAGPDAASGLDPASLPGFVVPGNAAPAASVIDRLAPGATVEAARPAADRALRFAGLILNAGAALLLALLALGVAFLFAAASASALAGEGREAVMTLHGLGFGDRLIGTRIAAGAGLAASVGTAAVLLALTPLVLVPVLRPALPPAAFAVLPVPLMAALSAFAAASGLLRRLR